MVFRVAGVDSVLDIAEPIAVRRPKGLGSHSMERLDVELKSPPFVSGLSVSFARRLLRFRCLVGQGQEEAASKRSGPFLFGRATVDDIAATSAARRRGM